MHCSEWLDLETHILLHETDSNNCVTLVVMILKFFKVK